eukprot:1774603-Alexandrium_andersonii.AAC.1
MSASLVGSEMCIRDSSTPKGKESVAYLNDEQQVRLLQQGAYETKAPVAVSAAEPFALQPGEQAVVPVKWDGR